MSFKSRVYKTTYLGNGKRIVSSMDTKTYAATYGIMFILKLICWYPIKYTFLVMYWIIALPIKVMISLINRSKGVYSSSSVNTIGSSKVINDVKQNNESFGESDYK